MKRTYVAVAAVVAALAATGLAVGKSLDGNSQVRALTGTFTATNASKVETRTCTTDDGKTLVRTTGTYTGAASGDADLTGTATLRAHSVVNTTDGIGVVSGTLRVDVASGRDTQASFDAVYSGGHVAGLAVGHAHAPATRLVANLSADFSASGGFTNGRIGSSAGGAAAELGPARCRPVHAVEQRSEAHGTVSAVSSTSITVAGLTCAVPAALQSRVARLHVGSRAAIRCSLVDSANTLTRVDDKRR